LELEAILGLGKICHFKLPITKIPTITCFLNREHYLKFTYHLTGHY
jgi:hypothetical protein